MFTSFETLPNEIIVEIIEYINIRELIISFWNLNIRFNKLICTLNQLSLILTKKSDLFQIKLFSQQIIRLVLISLDNIDLTPFINLRSLILNWFNENQLKQIQPNLLPNLVYFSLSYSFNIQITKQLISDIFSNRFPLLTIVNLGSIDIPEISSWSQSLLLHSISIYSHNINIIPLILQSCIQLKYFQIHIDGNYDLNISLFKQLNNHPLKHFIFLQSLNSIYIYDIENLIILMPNIKKIQLRLCTNSFYDLIKNLSKSLIYLNQFHCYIIESSYSENSIDINRIRNLHKSFNSIQCKLLGHNCRFYTSKQVKIKN